MLNSVENFTLDFIVQNTLDATFVDWAGVTLTLKLSGEISFLEDCIYGKMACSLYRPHPFREKDWQLNSEEILINCPPENFFFIDDYIFVARSRDLSS